MDGYIATAAAAAARLLLIIVLLLLCIYVEQIGLINSTRKIFFTSFLFSQFHTRPHQMRTNFSVTEFFFSFFVLALMLNAVFRVLCNVINFFFLHVLAEITVRAFFLLFTAAFFLLVCIHCGRW